VRFDRHTIGLTLAVAVLAGCGTVPPEPQDSAPQTSPPVDLAKIPDPEPTKEPRSRYGNQSPYEVLGKRYHVLPRADGYHAKGTASWYGTKFQGRSTSSGEPYDMYKLTAAHRNLPIPSYVRVTNLENQKTAIVRVNDRGPFHGGRIIDVSYAAAVKLGFASRGTANVFVEAVGPKDATVRSMASAVPSPAPVGEHIYLQAGAFTDRRGAERYRDQLARLIAADVHVHHNDSDRFYRVRVGPLPHMQEASRLQTLIATRYERPLIVME
jgi:rare lipoprotein A